MEIIADGIEQLPAAAKELLEAYPDARVFAIYGGMGAGKTTFIKEICNQLDCRDHVVSPTFAIINHYHTGSGESLYHCDFYRIDSVEEAINTGVAEYLTGEWYCFLEWPERIEPLLPESVVRITITVNDDGARVIKG